MGKDDPHFSTIIKVGINEKLIGQSENELCEMVSKVFYFPIKDIIDQDCKKMHQEKEVLEKKRLNFEIAKGKLRKATSGTPQYDKQATETETCNTEFVLQQERILKMLQVIHKKLFEEKAMFIELVDKQIHFHKKCIEYLEHSKEELAKLQ